MIIYVNITDRQTDGRTNTSKIIVRNLTKKNSGKKSEKNGLAIG